MDVKLYYTEKGSGEPMILLHGNGEDGSYFVHQTEYFSKKYRVIALDTRGHGKSPRGKAPFSIRQFAEDLKDFMDEMEISKAHILGFSDGGNIAMIFAMKYPERVDKLILNGANLDGKGVRSTVQIPVVAGYKIASLFSERSTKARANAELLGLMVNDPAIRPEELKKIKIPTLVIAGTKDMIREEHTKEIYRNLPKAKLALVKGDHFIARRNPAVFNRIVEVFLTKG